METEPAYLLDHLLGFGRLLRQMGVAVDPGQMIDLLQAGRHVEIGREEDFRNACRVVLLRRREDLPLFEQAWDFWWSTRRGGVASDVRLPDSPARVMQLPQRLIRHQDAQSEGREREERDELAVQLSYSPGKALREKDFADFDADEMDEARALLALLRPRIEQRVTRRSVPGRGRGLDLRRTMRRAMRTGGEALVLPRRERKLRQRPLVVLCDISGSMDRYSRILLQFVYAITMGLRDVETFVFGTRLTRITRLLRNRDIDEAVDQVAGHVRDWGGGTRIGEALKDFNFRWGRRVLGHGAVVLLISDGWDRGDPELVGRETARLQRTSHRLIWLNPLLGRPGYQPLTRGLQAALPYVDGFLPVHNLHSLEQLGEILAGLSA
ncbi:MAG: VWA domain-containing protein [Chloroflexota bacterium]|nr:VWA domain-containing protein [Chloroflexota bacterium]